MDTLENDEHAAAWPLLPWHATGRLAGTDEALVAAHLRHCATCQAELAWQRRLHGAAAQAGQDVPIPDADAALARLLPRLDEPVDAERRQPRAPGMLAALFAWLRSTPLVPAALAMMLVALFVVRQPDPVTGYRGLGPIPEAAGNTTVVFRPDTGAGEVRRILAAAGAGAVHGPTAAGAYVLEIAPGQRAAALERLRAESAVLMAEPLDAPEPR